MAVYQLVVLATVQVAGGPQCLSRLPAKKFCLYHVHVWANVDTDTLCKLHLAVEIRHI